MSIPSVTMNGGRDIRVTSSPLASPNPAQTRMPMRIARAGGTLPPTASLVITIVPNAMIAPLDRSIPAVRMINVCPIARVPTTITCWMIREKLPGVKKVSVRMAKNALASTSAARGPSVETLSRRRHSGAASGPCVTVSGAATVVVDMGLSRM